VEYYIYPVDLLLGQTTIKENTITIINVTPLHLLSVTSLYGINVKHIKQLKEKAQIKIRQHNFVT
jgi:Mg2+ and Co2+ transporter CorA